MTIVEQPEVVAHDFLLDLGADFASVRTASLGDAPDKLVRLYSARATVDLQPPSEPPPRPPRAERSQFQFADANARDRYRSSWRPFANLCIRVARARPSRAKNRLPATYAEAAERFAVWWHGNGCHSYSGFSWVLVSVLVGGGVRHPPPAPSPLERVDMDREYVWKDIHRER